MYQMKHQGHAGITRPRPESAGAAWHQTLLCSSRERERDGWRHVWQQLIDLQAALEEEKTP